MMDFSGLTRRRVLSGNLGTSTLAFGLGSGGRSARAKGLAVGFIYVGPRDDFGYNQAHAEGAAAIKSMPGVTLTDEQGHSVLPYRLDVSGGGET